jgi:hypothetical protein
VVAADGDRNGLGPVRGRGAVDDPDLAPLDPLARDIGQDRVGRKIESASFGQRTDFLTGDDSPPHGGQSMPVSLSAQIIAG